MRILLADDEKVLAHWLARALGQSGFRVDVVHDGRRALDAIKAAAYDALVLDLDMPILGGRDVLVMLRTLRNRVPVLVLTGGDIEDERLPADAVLTKPCAVEVLEARLIDLIHRPPNAEARQGL